MQTPKEFVDETSGEIKRIWDLMNTSYDKFIRTTDDYHEKQVQKIFKKLYDQGDIYKGHYVGKYCTPCESFFTDGQLIDGKCPDCGRPVQEAKEEAYFFKMSKYQDKLMKHIEQHPEFIQPESRRNEMVNNFLKPGLQDLCVSRTSFKWGIPVDFDPKHVVYVWVDALSNYITGLGYDVDGKSDEKFYKYWPADLHLIGKDILRFHTIYWPIMLMALGLPLPKQVFGHPWLLQSDGKMSKSKGNVMYADDMVNIFGVDAVRFFVLHEMPFENDGVISWELMVERLNSELANTLGNLVNRTISMSNKYFGGIVTNTNVTEPVDEDLKKVVMDCRYKVAECMDKLKVADAITEIFALFKRCNKYIDETMPWALAKEEDKKDRLNTVLYNLVESIVIGATLLEPYMPETTEKIMAQLNTEKRKVTELGKFGLYKSGTKVTEQPEILFARLDVKEVMAKVAEFAPVEKESMYEQAKKQKEEKGKNFLLQYFLQTYLYSGNEEVLKKAGEILDESNWEQWHCAILIESDKAFFDNVPDNIDEELMQGLHRNFFYLNLNTRQSVLFFSDVYCDYQLVAKHLYDLLKQNYSASFHLAVSSRFEGHEALPEIMSQLEQTMEEKFYHPDVHVFNNEASDSQPVNAETQDSRLMEKISEDISRKDVEQLKKHFECLVKKYENDTRFSAMYVKFVFSNVIQELFQENQFSEERKLDHEVERLYSCTNLKQILAITQENIKEYEEFLERSMSDSRDEVASVKNYIYQHYAEDLSLETLAEKVYLSSGYLSFIFKKETGMNLNRFIRVVRMEKAKELLCNSNMKVAQVSEQVGIPNVSYFCRSFREYYGSSPESYRKGTGEEDENTGSHKE